MARRRAQMSPQAAAWFLAEMRYLASYSPQAAARLMARMRAARQTLADFPLVGSVGLIPGTRRFVVADYVLTIKVRGGVAEIVAIRHGRQRDPAGPPELEH